MDTERNALCICLYIVYFFYAQTVKAKMPKHKSIGASEAAFDHLRKGMEPEPND